MADHIDDDERWIVACEGVHSDIAGRLTEFDGSMLVKYVALVEALGDDGQRALFTLGSKDLKPWESLGLTVRLPKGRRFPARTAPTPTPRKEDQDRV